MALVPFLLSLSLEVASAQGSTAAVICDVAPEEALTVARELGYGGADVSIWPLSALRTRPPYIVGAGAAFACSSESIGPPDPWIEDAQRAIGLVELDAAELAIERALEASLCGPFQAENTWKIWFLRGVIETYREREDRARAAFRNARNADPSRPWDDTYADGQAWFEEALPERADVRLSVLPDADALRIDGREVTGEEIALAAGSHTLEVGSLQPLRVRVELEGQRPAVLVVPALLPDSVLRWPQEPERWRDLSVIFGDLPGPPAAVGLYAPPDLWWSPAAQGPYQRLSAQQPPPARAPFPRWAAGLGAVGLVGAVTAVGCAVAAHDAKQEADDLRGAPYPLYAIAADRYHRLNRCEVAADAFAAVGFGSALVGFVSWRVVR